MPFDQKRINGPESSVSYRQYLKPEEGSTEQAPLKRVVVPDHFPIKLDVISKAKGSSFVENGNTKIICAVFELRETSRQTKYADKGQLHVDFRYSTFSRAVRKSVGENEEKLMTSSIKTALESAICFHEFPNYQLDVFILVLEDDGAVLSTSINAAGMALINASIPCYDMVSSSSAAVGAGGVLLDDPSTKEEEARLRSEDNQGTCSVSSLSSIDQISNVLFKGFIDPTALKAAKNHLHELNKKRSLYLKTVVVSEVERGLRET